MDQRLIVGQLLILFPSVGQLTFDQMPDELAWKEKAADKKEDITMNPRLWTLVLMSSFSSRFPLPC